MRPWNPYSLTRTGEAIVGQTPVRYVVYGPPLTPAQSTVLQGRYANFVGMARQSVVRNPSATGMLPDGSRYTIDCVGGACTCVVWTSSTSTENKFSPGIGVILAGSMWALYPPGGRNSPGSGRWKTKKVDVINGGVGAVFRAKDGNYFVESRAGVFRDNRKLTPALSGMGSAIYTWPENSLGSVLVSDPYIFKNSLEQLGFVGTSIVRRTHELAKGSPSGSAQESSYALPVLKSGCTWGMLTAADSGAKILACQADDELGSWLLQLRNVASTTALERDDDAGLQLVQTDSHAAQITRRDPPAIPGPSAPKYSKWETGREQSYTQKSYTLNNPNPYSQNPTFDVQGAKSVNTYFYTETSAFLGNGVFREYVDRAGVVHKETVRYTDSLEISHLIDSSWEGYDQEIWTDMVSRGTNVRDVKVKREAIVGLAGIGDISLSDLDIHDVTDANNGTSRSTYFLRYSYTSTGEISGFVFGGVATVNGLTTRDATIKRSLERVLVHDPQFGVAASIEIKVEATLKTAQGFDPVSAEDAGTGGDHRFDTVWSVAANIESPNPPYFIKRVETARTDKASIELVLRGPGGITRTVLQKPEGFDTDAEVIMSKFLLELAAVSGRGARAAPHPDDKVGTYYNLFSAEEELQGLIDTSLDGSLIDAQYAKDPKTGAGFFSVTWGAITTNKAVGTWGWSDSVGRTSIANTATPSSIVSI